MNKSRDDKRLQIRERWVCKAIPLNDELWWVVPENCKLGYLGSNPSSVTHKMFWAGKFPQSQASLNCLNSLLVAWPEPQL